MQFSQFYMDINFLFLIILGINSNAKMIIMGIKIEVSAIEFL